MHGALEATDLISIFLLIRDILAENRDYLISLDSAMGDGDLGITMTRGFNAACEEVSKSLNATPGKIFANAGMAMAKAAPSTMGTLMATGFMKGGKAIGEAQFISTPELANFFHAFSQGIMDRGKAKPGDKTVVDVLVPVAVSLSEDADRQTPLKPAITTALTVAQKALADSTGMKAQIGRAAYYQNDSIGKQDAGATVAMLMIQGFHKYITGTVLG
jgi:phosphoenolpyruvate---glycerone phosphotransferase subunit DhaL